MGRGCSKGQYYTTWTASDHETPVLCQSTANESEESRWMNEFVDIEKCHEEYWGPLENKSDGKDNDDDSCDEECNPMEMLKSNC